MIEFDGNNIDSDNGVTLLDVIGGWGPWQVNILLFQLLASFLAPFQTFGMIFYSPNIDFWCIEPNIANLPSSALLRKCSVVSIDNRTIECIRWDYDFSTFALTLVSEVIATRIYS